MVDHATTVVARAVANDKIDAAVAGDGSVTGIVVNVFPDTPSITTKETTFGIHASISYLLSFRG